MSTRVTQAGALLVLDANVNDRITQAGTFLVYDAAINDRVTQAGVFLVYEETTPIFGGSSSRRRQFMAF